MSMLISEERHESNSKGKPRLPQSQGDILKQLESSYYKLDESNEVDSEESSGSSDDLELSSESIPTSPSLAATREVVSDVTVNPASVNGVVNKVTSSKPAVKLASKVAAASSNKECTNQLATGTPLRLNRKDYTYARPRGDLESQGTDSAKQNRIPEKGYPEKVRSLSFSRKFSNFFRARLNSSAEPKTVEVPTSPVFNSDSFSTSIPNNLNIRVELATIKDYKRVARTLLMAFEDDPFTNYILNTRDITRENSLKTTYKKKKLDLMKAYFEYEAYECLSLYGKVFVIKDNLFESMMEDLSEKQKQRFPFLGVSCWHKIFGKNVETYYSLISSDDLDDLEDYSDDDFFADESMSRMLTFHPLVVKFNVFTFMNNCRLKVMKDKWPFLTKVRNEVLINRLMHEAGTDVANPTIDIWYLSNIATLPVMKGKGLGKLLINHVIEEYILKLNQQLYVYLELSNPVNRGFYNKLNFKVMASYLMKKKRYVDQDSVMAKDPLNKGVNMDAMVWYPKEQ